MMLKKVAQFALIAAIAPAPVVGSPPVLAGAELDVGGATGGDEAVVELLELLHAETTSPAEATSTAERCQARNGKLCITLVCPTTGLRVNHGAHGS